MNNKQKTPRSRVLSFENLENRELLSVSPIAAAAAETTSADRAALFGAMNVDDLFPGPIQFTLPEETNPYSFSSAIAEGGYVLNQPKITNSASTTKTITVGWNAEAGAASYSILYRKTSEKENQTINVADPAQTSVTINNLEPSTSYYVSVVAVGDGVTTSDSTAKTTKTIKTQALATLVQPTVTVTSTTTHTIGFSWNASDGAVNYDVMYRKSTDKAFTTIENVAETSMTLTNLDAGASYVVKVVANGDYNVTKDSAATKSKTIKTVALQKLAQPKITTLVSEMHTVDVAWSAVDDATGYEVQYRKSSEKTYTIYDGEITGTNVTINGLDPNTTYYFRVVAKGDGDVTGDSAAKSVKTIKTKPLITLAKPTISSIQTTESSATVNWNAIADAANVSVICKRNGTSEKQTFVVDSNETRLTVTGLIQGAKYTFSIVANGDYITTANSPTSATKTVALPKYLKAASPAIINATATARSITFSWAAVENAARYEISYSEVNGSVPTVVSIAATETSYTFTDLEPNKSYYVQARAIGDNGYANSDYCQPTILTTLEQTSLAIPTNLCGTAGANSATLLWDAVDGAVGYSVMYGPENGETTTLLNIADATNACYIEGLAPNTTYVFRVRANGAADLSYDSDFSTAYALTTLNLTPLAAPNARVVARTTSLVTVEWTPDANATGYMVVYGKTGETDVTTERLGADATSFTVYELPASTSYTFQITAVGDDQEYASSEATELVVATQTQLAAPIPQLKSRTTHSIGIEWASVENASGYTVAYGRAGETANSLAFLTADETEFLLEEINETEAYTFYVYADGDGDDYATSLAGDITVASLGQLAAPTLTATSGIDSITVSWDANENAVGYSLAYGKVGEDPTTIQLVDQTEFTLSELEQGAFYEFEIVAVGDGDYASSIPTKLTVGTLNQLSAPNVTATRTLNSIKLDWNADENATGYRLTYGKTGETGQTIRFDADATSYALAGLESATTYAFQLVAEGDGDAYVSSEATVVELATQDKLATPTVTATRGLNSITLNWNANENATGYELSYGQVGGDATTVTVADSDAPYVVSGLDASTSYTFALTALGDDDYYVSSDASETTVATQTQLAAPALEIAALDDASVVFAWKPVANAQGYSLFFNGAEDPITLAFDATSYEFDSLTAETKYTLTIVAIGDGENYVASEEATLDATTLYKLATPTLSFASDVNAITVEWNDYADKDKASGYALVYGLENDDKTTFVTIQAGETGYGVAGLDPAEQYFFQLTALGDGTSYVSSETSTAVETTLGQLSAPVAEVLERTPTSITIAWDEVDDASGYAVYCGEETLYKGSDTSFEATNLKASTPYAFRVVALGEEDGDYVDSEETVILTATQTQLATPEIIATSTDSALALAWRPIANATGYALVYGEETYYKNFDDTSFVLEDLEPGATYTFELTALSDFDDYADSNVATIEVATLLKLDAPELKVAGRTLDSITLAWDADENASGYTLVYGKSGETATLTTTIASNETDYVVTGLESGESYAFALVAEGDGVDYVSSEAATIEGTTQVQLVAPVLSVKERTTDSITVEWGNDANASGYALCLDGVAVNAALGPDAASYPFNELKPGTSYAFQIVATGEANGEYADSASSEKYYFTTLAPLTTPTLTATALSDSEIALAWSSVANASGYTLVYPGGEQTFKADETSFVLDGLTPGASVEFTLTALAPENGDYVASTATASAATLGKFSAPENFEAVAISTDSVTLAWSAGASAGYVLAYGKQDAATTTVTLDSDATGYVVNDLTPGATYTFQLVAVGDAAHVGSDAATVANVTTKIQLATPSLALTSGYDSISGEVNAVANASGYEVKYYVGDAVVGEGTAVTLEGNAFNVPNLAQGAVYTFTVVAKGEGSYVDSAAVAQTITTAEQTKLTAPTITEVKVTNSTAALTWTPVANTKGYELTVNGVAREDLLSANATTFVVEGLESATAYTFTLTAKGDDVDYLDSDPSAPVAKTTLGQYGVPENFAATEISTDSVKLVWDLGGNNGYTLVYGKQDDSTTTTVAIKKNAMTYTATGLEAGATYAFQLVAVGSDAYVGSAAATLADVTTKIQLATPTLTLTSGENSISGTVNAVDNASGYEVKYYVGDAVVGEGTAVTLDGAAFNVTNLEQGAVYTFTVVAKGEGAYVDSAVGTQTITTDVAQTQLATPELTATALSTSELAVSWKPVPNASSYTLVYSGGEQTFDASVTSFVLDGLDSGASVTFTLTAKGAGAYTDSADATASATTFVQLATPTLTPSARTLNTITVDWSDYADKTKAVGYTLVYGEKNSGETLTAAFDGEATDYTVAGLKSGTVYEFALVAEGDDEVYVSSEAGEREYKTQTQLSAPTLTLGARTTDSITVEWSANASGYTLYQDGVAVNAALDATATSYAFNGLDDGTSHAFQIVAKGVENGEYADSALSEKYNFSTLKTLVAPTNFTATAISDTAVALSWTPVSNASGYVVSYGDNQSVELDAYYDQSVTIEGLAASTSHTFTIIAKGEGDYVSTPEADAATATATTLGLLDPPAITSATPAASSIKLDWALDENASGYTLVYSKAGDVAKTTAALGKVATYTATGLESGATYEFELVAEGDGVKFVSSSAATINAKTFVKLNAPTNVTLVEQTTHSIGIEWDASQGATSYKVVVTGDVEKEETVNTPSYRLEGLEPVTSYTIEIVALGDEDKGYVDSDPASINVATLGKLATPNVTNKERTDTTISFAWDAVVGASSYTLVYGKEGGTTQTITLQKTTTSYTFDRLDSGTTYVFQLSANGDGYVGSDVAEFNVFTLGTLATPTVTSIVRSLDQKETPDVLTDDTASITFSWNAVANADGGYELQYKKSSDDEWSTQSVVAGNTTVTITGLTTATEYSFYLKAYGPQNAEVDQPNYASSTSQTINVTTQAKLAAPTLNYSARTTNTITVTWSADANASDYSLEYRNGSGAWAAAVSGTSIDSSAFSYDAEANKYTCVVGTYDADEEKYVGGELQPGTSYQFRLKALGATGEDPDYLPSEYSTTVTKTTQTQLAAPTGVQATSEYDSTTTKASITFSWNAVEHADGGYEIQYKKGDDDWSTETVEAGKTSATITGQDTQTMYTYRVKALASAGDSDYADSNATEPAFVTTVAKLATPESITSTHTTTSIALAWNAVDHATGYKVTYGVKNGTTTTVTVTENSFDAVDLVSGETYAFVIKAIGDSTYLDSETATIDVRTQMKLVATAPYSDGRTTNSITVAWAEVENASDYELKYQQKIEGEWPDGWDDVTNDKILTDGVYTCVVTGLTTGATYRFRIKALGDAGEVVNYLDSDPVDSNEMIAQTQLAKQTLTLASRTTSKITVDWSGTADLKASGYKLEYRQHVDSGAENTWTAISTTEKSYEVSGLASGSYDFRVTAIGDDAADPLYLDSEVSAVATFSTQAFLAPPTLTLASESSESATISWNSVEHATGYELYLDGVKVDGTFTYDEGNKTYSYEKTDLTAGSYSFTVVAKGNDGNDPDYYDSEESDDLTVTKLAETTISFSNVTTNSMTVAWTEVENATDYELAFRKSTDSSWTEVSLAEIADSEDGFITKGTVTISGEGTAYAFAGLAAGTGYQFKVVAKGDKDQNIVSTETTSDPQKTQEQLAAPTFSEPTRTTNSITVGWTKVENATGYDLQYRAYVENNENEDDWTSVNSATFVLNQDETAYTCAVGSLSGKYEFRIKAKALSGGDYVDSDWSTLLTEQTQVKLVVTKLEATRTTNSVTLNWTVNDATGVTGYTLQCLKDGNVISEKTPSASATSYSFALGEGMEYTFELVAKGDVDQTDPDYLDSAKKSITVVTAKTLDAPTLSCASDTSKTNEVTVSWGAVTNATGYELYIGDVKVDETFTAGQESYSYSKTDLTAGNTYTFKVKALGNAEDDTTKPAYVDSAFSSATVTTLAAPVITASAQSTTEIKVEWDAVTTENATATGYKLYFGDATDPIATFNAGQTSYSYSKTGLTAGETYTFKVVALGNGTDVISSSATKSASTQNKLVAPTLSKTVTRGLDSTGQNATLTVSWASVENADGYTLYYTANGGTEQTAANIASTATSYELTNLTPGTTYSIQLVANASSNYVDSDRSEEITATTQAKLDPPTVTIDALTDTTINVSWTSVDHADGGYTVQYKTAAESAWTEKTSLETSYGLTGLTGGTEYQIKVKANGSENGDYVAATSGQKTATTKTKLGTPTDLSVTARGLDTTGTTDVASLTVSWTADENAPAGTTYTVQYKKTSDTDSDWLTTPSSTTSATLSNLTPGVEYTIKVRAENSGDTYVASDDSELISSTTQQRLVMSTVTTAKALNADATEASITFSWDAVANADRGYTLKYKTGNGAWITEDVDAGTSVTINGLTPETEYTYQVQALAATDETDVGPDYKDSEWTAEATVTTLGKLPALAAGAISAVSDDSNSITLSWSTSEYVGKATGFVVSYLLKGSVANPSTRDVEYDSTAETLSYTLEGLKPGTTYIVSIQAIGDDDLYVNSDDSPEVEFATKQGETYAPTDLKVTQKTAKTATLGWTAAENAARYQIYTIQAPDSVIEIVGETTETSYAITGLTPGGTYTYCVKTIGATGYADSEDSASVTFMTEAQTELEQPSAPTLTIPVVDNEPTVGAFNVTWETVEHASGFEVRYYKSNDFSTAVTIKDIPATATSTSITGLDEGATYVVDFRAIGDDDLYTDSSWSSTSDAKTTAYQLSAPTINNVTSEYDETHNTSSITFEWSAVENASGYSVECVIGGSVVKNDVGVMETSYTFEGLTPGNVYTIRVKAQGNGATIRTSDAASMANVKTKSLP